MCNTISLIDSSYGIYCFDELLNRYRGQLRHGPSAIDYNVLRKGPTHELYFEVVDYLLSKMTIILDSVEYSLDYSPSWGDIVAYVPCCDDDCEGIV